MIDTNVLIDLREALGPWRDWSLGAVADAKLRGPIAASAIVVGELAGRGGSFADIAAFLLGLGIAIEPLTVAAAFRAGEAHRSYRLAGGTRQRLLGDFLIGGHAAAVDAELITRDPSHYRRYFPDLILLTPETDHD